MISPVHMLALAEPGVVDRLSDEEIALLYDAHDLYLRPEQRIPIGDWRSYGFVTGRGWGKTFGIAIEIHRRVVEGECKAPALIGPTEHRVRDVQVASLLQTAPAWCPCEPYRAGVRWENGVIAEPLTAEIERPASGSNFDFAWMTEIVRWNPAVRRKAFDDITTACRVGDRPQYVWDTTSSGKNDVIQFLIEQHEHDPQAHRIVRGTMFDNPVLTEQYLRDEIRKYGRGTRRYDEEILGLVFAEASGALWRQEWIDHNRVHAWPSASGVTVIGLDPALSDGDYSDETGIAIATRVDDRIYVDDVSDRMSPEQYAKIVIRECSRRASGVVVERNHQGSHARDLIRVHAGLAGMRIELLPNPDRPFPARRPGTIFVREVVSHRSKETRAAPVAALYAAGQVSHVGELAALENEMTTWEPGTRRSPNRLDAVVFAASELGNVAATRRDAASDVRVAARASARLRQRSSRGRGVGL